MWIYEKKLQYPVKIKNPDPRMAKVIISQYGGAFAVRYNSGSVIYIQFLSFFRFYKRLFCL